MGSINSKYSFLLDTCALLAGKACLIAVRLVAICLLAIKTDRGTFGIVAFGMTITEMSRLSADWGGDVLGVNRYSNPEKKKAISAFALGWRAKCISSVMAIIISYVALTVIGGIESQLTLLILCSLAVTPLWFNLGINWMQSRRELQRVICTLLILGFVSISIQYLMLRMSVGINYKLGSLVICEMIISVFMMIESKHSVKRLTGNQVCNTSIGWRDLHSWMKDGSPIAAATILCIIYTRFDQLYIEKTQNVLILGDYCFMQRIVEVMVFITAAIAATTYVRGSEIVHRLGEYSTTFKQFKFQAIKNILFQSVSLALIMALFTSFIMPHIFPEYSNTKNLFYLSCLIIIFRSMNQTTVSLIQATGNFRTVLKLTFVNILIAFAAISIGGHKMGVIGVILGVIAAEGANLIIQVAILSYKYIDNWFQNPFWKKRERINYYVYEKKYNR